MDHFAYFVILLISSGVEKASSCFCEHYPWASWSSCSKTCNYGTQSRGRQIRYDEYYNKNLCEQLCTKHETRACNQQACPINCQLGDVGPWSECDPCLKKQFRVRSLVRPSQFGGQACSGQLTDSRQCIPSKICNIEEADCTNKFKCDTGRCIARNLQCNGDNDCGDNSDERGCRKMKLCKRSYENIPGVQLMGNGFNFLSGESRGEVLDNSFYGGKCLTVSGNGTGSNRKFYRLPANVEDINFQVENKEDDVGSKFYKSLIDLNDGNTRHGLSDSSAKNSKGIPFLWHKMSNTRATSSSSYKDAVQASYKKSSHFIRINKVISVSDFTMKQNDLWLSDVFLKALHHLPLEYNYALYSRIFDDFGTHYFTAGSMGGAYDLLYQYSSEELKSSGLTETESSGCVRTETTRRVFFFFKKTNVQNRCTTNKMSEHYQGSFLQSSEKSISLVKGGRAEYAAALAWNREGAFPENNVFTNWVASTIDNPVIVKFEEIEQVHPEPDTGCPKPEPPEHGFFRNEKNWYSIAEEIEMVCVSGYELSGYQFLRCLPDGTWKNENAECHRTTCPRPPASDDITIFQFKTEYKIGESIRISCSSGFLLTGQNVYTCGSDLAWTPPILTQLSCGKEIQKVTQGDCSPGQKQQGSQCVCMSPEKDCGHHSEDLCIYDATIANYLTMSSCQYMAERCLGKKQLHYLNSGPCQSVHLNWVHERITLSATSSKKEPCGYDFCYDWEKCSESQCFCLLPYQCPDNKAQLYCIKIGSAGRQRTVNICSLGAMKCAKMKAEILYNSECTE
ncbi:hypothetical protein FKM82_000180 [Ascaphus truei]